jgi:hypothetical protein
MERRGFLATLCAPLIAKFLPAKAPVPAAELPIASVPLMGSGQLKIVQYIGSPSISKFQMPDGMKVYSGDAMTVNADGFMVRATDNTQPVMGWALGPPDCLGMVQVMMTRPF